MAKNRNDSVRVGRTIAQEWEKQESESERLAARKKGKVRRASTVAIAAAVLALIALFTVISVSNFLKEPEEEVVVTSGYEPTVEIVDENGAGVTKRMKSFIGQAEVDFKAEGYKISRVVVPAGKTREVDVFLEGREFYVKLNIDRGTAVGAEDARRMIEYLDGQGISPEYIDVRVEGKGYYK